MDYFMACDLLDAPETVVATPEPVRRRNYLAGLKRLCGFLARKLVSGVEWSFGMVTLVVALSSLAALPVLQLFSLGYFLESSARVARSGRLRDGFIGVRRAARVGGVALGTWLATVPAWLAAGLSSSAELIDPGGFTARAWWAAFLLITSMTLPHLALAYLRGGKIRHFLWPVGNLLWLRRQVSRKAQMYAEARDNFWMFISALHAPYYFRLGLVGFFGTLAWLIVPSILIALGGRFPPAGILGALMLAIVVPFLPFLQVRYAVEGQVSALFKLRPIRDRFRRAPWAFAFALLILLTAAIPLYFLKIEMVPREAAWLPSVVFVIFLAPARLLTGWAYARAGRRDQPRHWLLTILGRLAIIPTAIIYVLIVFLAQYTSWGGAATLYEQHAFLLPVPFLNM
jgi:hypothetical protein